MHLVHIRWMRVLVIGKGYFKLNADNTIEPLSSLVAGWGDSMDSMREGKYDPETGQISWYIDYAGQMTFYVVMNK